MSAPDWTKMLHNKPSPPPGGWAMPHGTGPGFLAVALAMIEDAGMRPEKPSYEEQTEHERQMELAQREYDALCHGRKEGKQP